MGIAAEIRKQLPLCGNCINCKLLVWDERSELKVSQTLIKVKELVSTPSYYTVRCSWLKTSVIEPQLLVVCEGKQEQGGGRA